MNSFAFKFGKVEIAAKLPAVAYPLVPSIKFLPLRNSYGNWPASGEIDLVEAHGNRDSIKSSLQYGPYAEAVQLTSFTRSSNDKGKNFATAFHRYQMEWTADKITFSVDDIVTFPHWFFILNTFFYHDKIIFILFLRRKREQSRQKASGRRVNSKQNIRMFIIHGQVQRRLHHSTRSFTSQLDSPLAVHTSLLMMISALKVLEISHWKIIQPHETFGRHETVGCQHGKLMKIVQRKLHYWSITYVCGHCKVDKKHRWFQNNDLML